MGRKLLVKHSDGAETRQVWLVEGKSLAVVEQTRGPATELAYGGQVHGHKALFSEQACRRALDVQGGSIEGALRDFFDQDDQEVLLSDLMDAFDRVGQAFTYASWSDEGDAAYRACAPK